MARRDELTLLKMIADKKALITNIKEKIAALKSEAPKEMTIDDINERQYRRAAAEMMNTDPEKAMELIAKADAIASRQEIAKQRAAERKAKISNKFDLSTDEGKLLWKETFERAQGKTTAYGWDKLSTTDKNAIKTQINNLIAQAANYPEVLNSVGNPKPYVIKEAGTMSSDEVSSAVDNILNSIAGHEILDENGVLIGYKNLKLDANGKSNAGSLIGQANVKVDELYGDKSAEDKAVIKENIKNILEPIGTQLEGGEQQAFERGKYFTEQKQKQIERITTLEKDYKAMNEYADKMSSSTDNPTRRAAINVVLRKETGATIAADEFENLMGSLLSSSDYNALKGDLRNVSSFLLGKVGGANALTNSMIEKYISKIDPNKFKAYVRAQTPDEYYKIKGKKSNRLGSF